MRGGKNRAAAALSLVIQDRLAREPADQPTVGIRHQHSPGSRLEKYVSHVMHARIRSIGSGVGVHHVFDARARIVMERLAAEITQDDAVVGHHDTQVVTDVKLANTLTQVTG